MKLLAKHEREYISDLRPSFIATFGHIEIRPRAVKYMEGSAESKSFVVSPDKKEEYSGKHYQYLYWYDIL